MSIAATLLWSALAAAFVFGAAFPLATFVLARVVRFVSRPGAPIGSTPLRPVTVLVVAAHAEAWILERLRRLLALDYPAELLEITVVCSADNDLTPDIARTIDDARVRVIEPRRGIDLNWALKSAVETSRGEIVVCIDCNVDLAPDALRRLAERFETAQTGLVSAPVTASPGQKAIATTMRLSALLSGAESGLGLYLPVTPGVTAARRDLWTFLPGEPVLDSMPTAREARSRGLRVEFLEAALGEYRSTDEEARLGWEAWESRGWRLTTLVRRSPWLRKLWRPEVAAFWILHVGLWVCPVFLFVALAANCALCGDPRYLRLLLVHESLYIAALVFLGRLLPRQTEDLHEERSTGRMAGTTAG